MKNFSSEQALIKYVESKIDRTKRNIVLVGGSSCAGKTTLSKIITSHYESTKTPVQYISLDDWVLSASKRTASMNVYNRFQSDKLECDYKRLLNNEKISIDVYDRITREQSNIQKKIKLLSRGVIIVDGVVALGLTALLQSADIKIFVDVVEEVRRQRFFKLYTLKGLSIEQIAQLYEDRLADEAYLINSTKNNADVIVKF